MRRDSKGRVLRDGETERKDGLYMYRWTDPFGKRHAIYSKTLAELREKEQLPQFQSYAPDMTVDLLFIKWLDGRSRLRPQSKYSYTCIYNRYIKDYIGSMPMKNLNRNVMENYRENILRDFPRNPDRFRRIQTVLNDIFTYGVRLEVLEKNPGFELFTDDFKSEPRRKRSGLSKKNQEQLLAQLENSPYEPLVKLLLLTGLRINEALAITCADIDFEGNRIKINKSLAYYKAPGDEKIARHIGKTKTENSNRYIPIPEALIPYFKARKPRKMPIIDSVSGFVFTGSNGYPFLPEYVNRTLEKARKEIGGNFPPVTCHVLRHTCATRLIEQGTNPKAVQNLLGHKSVSTTFDIYTDYSESLEAEARNAINTLNDMFDL